MELDDGHGKGDGQTIDQVFQILKRRKRKTITNVDQRKGINRFCFGTQNTLEGVSVFRIDSRTIKRKKSRLKQLSSATR